LRDSAAGQTPVYSERRMNIIQIDKAMREESWHIDTHIGQLTMR
jgi:hypothetical protein